MVALAVADPEHGARVGWGGEGHDDTADRVAVGVCGKRHQPVRELVFTVADWPEPEDTARMLGAPEVIVNALLVAAASVPPVARSV